MIRQFRSSKLILTPTKILPALQEKSDISNDRDMAKTLDAEEEPTTMNPFVLKPQSPQRRKSHKQQ